MYDDDDDERKQPFIRSHTTSFHINYKVWSCSTLNSSALLDLYGQQVIEV